MAKVRIKAVPKAALGGGPQQGLDRFFGGKSTKQGISQFSKPDLKVNETLKPVPVEDSNVEAEKGETAVVPGQGGIPELYTVGGTKHYNGGTPLNLAPDSFIFSDTSKMKIKDKEILKEFMVPITKKGKQKGYTPADLSKKYKLNKFKKVLMDEDSDDIERDTAEKMIKNNNIKLAKLALVQESMKGFENGIPEIATPYMETMKVDPAAFLPEQEVNQDFQAKYGGDIHGRFPGLSVDNANDKFKRGGSYDSETGAYYAQEGLAVGDGEAERVYDDPEARSYTAPNGAQYSINQDGTYEQTKAADAVVKEPDEEIEIKATTTKHADVPDKYDAPMYDQTSTEYNPNNLLTGDYVKTKEGTWREVEYAPAYVRYQEKDLSSTFGGNKDFANSYAYVEHAFQDKEVRDKFADETRKALLDKKYYEGKSGGYSAQYSPEEVSAMSDDYLVEQFLKMQKRNTSLKANGIDSTHFNDRDGSVKKEFASLYADKNITSLNEAFAFTGTEITDADLKSGAVGVQQATYWGYNNLVINKDSYDPEMQEKLKFFLTPQEGTADEPGEFSSISPIDSKKNNYYTNTSAGELAWVDLGEIDFGDPLGQEEIEPVEEISLADPEFVTHQPRDEWWAQDIGNIGNLFGQRMGIKKYLPNSTPIDLQRPDVLYFDPSRALAANAEQSNIAAQAQSAFAGPQGTARSSEIAGKAFANAANVLADYEGKNVQVGNQYLNQVNQVANQEHLANNERNQRLFDQTTVANQQFDNAKRMTNRNLFDAWRQGLSNKKMTQAMNAMYPQFETRPGTGGGMYFTGNKRPFTDTGSTSQNGNSAYLEEFQKLKESYPGASDSAIKSAMDSRQASPLVDPNKSQRQNFMNMLGNVNSSNGAYAPNMFPI